ncbi:MAG: hypothetical protein IH924_04135 [Proteobacteria bacterium]|nr:hypothetical protein [Pseudomonadota bacterium]
MPAVARDIFDRFAEVYDRQKHEDLSLQDYLAACRDDPLMYASAAERMIAAIGELPEDAPERTQLEAARKAGP